MIAVTVALLAWTPLLPLFVRVLEDLSQYGGSDGLLILLGVPVVTLGFLTLFRPRSLAAVLFVMAAGITGFVTTRWWLEGVAQEAGVLAFGAAHLFGSLCALAYLLRPHWRRGGSPSGDATSRGA